jgi:uncharacterized protein YndB with AHSA1/START domain
MIDIVEQINAVRRQVGTRVLETGEARSVIISQTYDTDIDDLWDACTNPERIPRWFLPVTGELRLGGRYQLEGNAGGTIERCDPPKSFSATWEFGEATTWIEVRLSPNPDGGTRLELEHIAHVDEQWAQFGPGAVGIGWDLVFFMGLARYLAAEIAADPRQAAAWVASDEGKQFITLSGERWRDADIAAGADPADATAAADRTTAAYTAPPPDAPSES